MAQTIIDRRRGTDRRRNYIALGCVALALGLALAALYGPMWWRYAAYEPRAGDVIFQSLPRGALVDAIEGATHSPWSHCGIVARDERGRWVVYEAFDGVEATPLREFLFRSRAERYAVYRWQEAYQPRVPEMLAAVRTYLGRPYDARYRLGDDAIYCSELIYKAFRTATGEEAGKMVTLGDLDWQPHRALIERLEQGDLPLDREMITPRDLAQAEQLQFVLGNNLDR